MTTVRWNVAVSAKVDQAKSAASNMTEAELDDLIEDAVRWARRSKALAVDAS
jgi:hypothetical protein